MKYNKAELISVGTELLLGDIINTNAAYLSRRLADIGISVYYQSTVGDNPERLALLLEESFSRADLIILTGGLGPTCDDLTKETVAEYFNLPLIINEEAMTKIKDRFNHMGWHMTANNEKQAYVPEGAVVFQNTCGTAPGMAITDGAHTAILLPGPPMEMETMFEKSAVPYISKDSDYVLRSINMHMYGIGESAAENILRSMMDAQNPTVAPYCGDGEVRIRVTARASNPKLAEIMCRETGERILETEAGEYVYCITDTPQAAKSSPVTALIAILREKGLVMSVAESCTGGLVGKMITDISGSSDIFSGGVISYSNEVKKSILGVSSKILIKYGAVSEECAAEMAKGGLRVCNSDVSIAVTGIAGPEGGSDKKSVGTVCFGIADINSVNTFTMNFGEHRSRETIRLLAAVKAIHTVREYAENK